jgi:hypothetical protein
MEKSETIYKILSVALGSGMVLLSLEYWVLINTL